MKRITFLAIAILLAIPAMAVTDKEMEEAKAIAAHAYLRYANDGSGYLDEINPTSMGALESKLRAKEQENLKAFKSVKIPGDYATWDKDRLVQFWSLTFFSSPNLSDKGKLAKGRVKSRISAMNIGAAPAAAAPAAEEPAAAESEAAPAEETKPVAEAAPAAAETAAAAGEEILADQEAMAQDEEQTAPRHESNSTWIYVVVLILLIGAVVWLLMFASKMMKGGNESADEAQSSRATRRSTAADQQPAVAQQPAAAQQPQPDKKSEALLRQYAATVDQLNADNDLLRTENNRIKNEKAQLEAQIMQLNAMIQDLRQRAAQAAQAQQSAPVASTAATPATPKPAPAPQHEHPAESGMPNVIYLGRANRQGLFVRADRRLAPNASIYRLDTSDGLVGTFHVVNHPEVVEFATSNPIDNLERGCIADDLLATSGVTSIITESAGTAIFEGGCWKVLRKSRIRYE